LASRHPRLCGGAKDVAPVAHDVSAARWANVAFSPPPPSSTSVALLPVSYTAPFADAWQALWEALPPGNGLRCRPSRLLHYRSANDIKPAEVDDTFSIVSAGRSRTKAS
jgi:hypothetical protein